MDASLTSKLCKCRVSQADSAPPTAPRLPAQLMCHPVSLPTLSVPSRPLLATRNAPSFAPHPPTRPPSVLAMHNAALPLVSLSRVSVSAHMVLVHLLLGLLLLLLLVVALCQQPCSVQK